MHLIFPSEIVDSSPLVQAVQTSAQAAMPLPVSPSEDAATAQGCIVDRIARAKAQAESIRSARETLTWLETFAVKSAAELLTRQNAVQVLKQEIAQGEAALVRERAAITDVFPEVKWP